MAARNRSRAKGKSSPSAPAAAVAPPPPDPRQVRRGRAELAGGAATLLAAVVLAVTREPTTTLDVPAFGGFLALLLAAAGALATGALRLDRRAASARRRDPRRWIYGGLAVGFGLFYTFAVWRLIPNRLPSGMLHLATFPALTAVMALGALLGDRRGWWIAVVGGSLVLASTVLLLARILASAAFLAGVYGAFGKAAASFALIAAAIVVELVALLPICQIRFLMSRAGRRAYGVG